MTEPTKPERLSIANKLIQCIASCGRRFFFTYNNRVACLELDARSRVWWIDEYSQKRIYTHGNYRWMWFSHGGTMRELVECLRDWVIRGTRLPTRIFGPWPESICGGDSWGYGEDMARVRRRAVELGLIEDKSNG